MKSINYIIIPLLALALLSCKNELPDNPKFEEAYNAANANKLDSIELSFNYCQTAIELADKDRNSKLLGRAYWMMAHLHDLSGDVSDAMRYYDAASGIYEHNKDYKSAITLLENSGSAALGADAFKVALIKYTDRLELVKANGEGNDFGEAYHDIALAHQHLTKIDSANHYELLALDFATDSVLKSNILNQLGIIQAQIGDYDSARLLYNDALALDPSGSKKYKVMNNIAKSYLRAEEYSEAKDWYLKTLPLAERIDDRAMIKPLNGLGKVYYDLGQLDSATFYFKQSIEHNQVSDAETNQKLYEQSLTRSTTWTLGIAFEYLEELDSGYAASVVKVMIMDRFSDYMKEMETVVKQETIQRIELSHVRRRNDKLNDKIKEYELAETRQTGFIVMVVLIAVGMIGRWFYVSRQRIVEAARRANASRERMKGITSS